MNDGQAGARDSRISVAVWDVPVRLVHWALVALVAYLYVSAEWQDGANALHGAVASVGQAVGLISPDAFIIGPMQGHVLAGQAVVALVIFRVLWGLMGSRTARFTDFLAGPRKVMAYIASVRGGKEHAETETLGHNPAGGWSVMALLLLLAVQAGTGLFANDDIFTEGPLASLVSKGTSDSLTGLHHLIFNGLLAIIILHVGAVFFYLLVKRENLIRPMVTGRKTVPAGRSAPLLVPAWIGLPLLVLVFIGVWFALGAA